VAGVLFWFAERRATEPILPLHFFRIADFTLANGAAFFSSFAVFSLIAFLPLFVQGAMGRTAAELGLAMIPLSLGWSAGALLCGQVVNRSREKALSVAGALLMFFAIALTLNFHPGTGLIYFSAVTSLIGIGMGFISVATLLKVQNSLDEADLGVATSSQQFARTLGGTIGIGISGSMVSNSMDNALQNLMNPQVGAEISPTLALQITENLHAFLRPDNLAALSTSALQAVQQIIGNGVAAVFWSTLLVSAISIIFSLMMSKESVRS
jgi:predicted MFS family arabinose efflux permease